MWEKASEWIIEGEMTAEGPPETRHIVVVPLACVAGGMYADAEVEADDGEAKDSNNAEISLQRKPTQARASDDLAWGIGRCNVLCRPMLHVASADAPCCLYYPERPILPRKFVLFTVVTSWNDTFLTFRRKKRSCKSLIITIDSI